MVNLLKLLFTGGLIYWLIDSGHLNVTEVIHILKPQYMIFCLLIIGMQLLTVVFRWYILIRAKSFETTYWELAKLTLIGTFFNFVMPSSVGGDVVKGFYVAKENPNRKLEAVSTILMDRVLGLYSLIALAVIAVSLNLNLISGNSELRALVASVFILFSVVTLVITIAFSEKLRTNERFNHFLDKVPGGGLIKKVYASFGGYSHSRTLILKVLGVSFVGHCINISLFIFVGQILGATEIPLAAYFFCVPVALVFTAVPLSPAGIGVGQVAMLALFKIYTGYETTVGQTAITVFQVTLLSYAMVGAFFYLKRSKKIKDLQAVES